MQAENTIKNNSVYRFVFFIIQIYILWASSENKKVLHFDCNLKLQLIHCDIYIFLSLIWFFDNKHEDFIVNKKCIFYEFRFKMYYNIIDDLSILTKNNK